MNFELPSEWEKAIEKVSSSSGISLVIGEVNVGKSTFVKALSNKLLENKRKVAIIDSDVGQSDLGPPTTIGLSFIEERFNDYSSLKVDKLFFVGSTTPTGNLLRCLIGVQKMVEEAKGRAEHIIVNTTGMVHGGAGIALKHAKIDLLSPNHIFAFPVANELSPILFPYRKIKSMNINFLPISEKARPRDVEERRIFRENKFKEYFNKNSLMEVPLGSIGLWGVSLDKLKYDIESLKGTLLGLFGENNEFFSLGILEDFSYKRKSLIFYLPAKNKKEVFKIVFGASRWHPHPI